MDDESVFAPHSGAQSQPDAIDRVLAELTSERGGAAATAS